VIPNLNFICYAYMTNKYDDDDDDDDDDDVDSFSTRHLTERLTLDILDPPQL